VCTVVNPLSIHPTMMASAAVPDEAASCLEDDALPASPLTSYALNASLNSSPRFGSLLRTAQSDVNPPHATLPVPQFTATAIDALMLQGAQDASLATTHYAAIRTAILEKLDAYAASHGAELARLELDAVLQSILGLLQQTHASEPPFTIQRVCELVAQPQSEYGDLAKFLRALEKALNVTSPYARFVSAE
jgi:hypothetical protein